MPLGLKTLGQVAWTPSLGVEALKKKVGRLRPSKKSEGKEWGWERLDDFWFLGSSHWDICILLWFFCPGFPESFQWVSLFLEASWSRASLHFDSDLVLDPSLPDTNRGNIYFSTIKSEILYSLLRIGCTDHQIQITSILGWNVQSVSECVLGTALLIPEPLQEFALPVPGQSCHFLNHKMRSTASGRRHPGSRSL